MLKDSHENDLSSKFVEKTLHNNYNEYKRRIHILKKLSPVLALIIVIFSIFILIGWVLDIAFLRGDIFFFYASKFNTGLLLLLSGLTLYILNRSTSKNKLKVISSILSIIILGFAFITFIEYIFGINIGIDQLLYTQSTMAQNELYMGRLKLLTSLTFIFLSLALFLDSINLKKCCLIQGLCVFGGFIAYYGFIINLYGIQLNHIGDFYAQMGFFTSILGMLLAAGILFYHPDKGLMRIINCQYYGGKISRLLIVTTLLIILFIGLSRIFGENYHLFSSHIGTALMVIFSSILLFILIIVTSDKINKLDYTQQKAFKIIKNLKRFYESIIESLNEGIFVTNEKDDVIYYNAGFKHITGNENLKFSGSEFKFLTKEDTPFFKYYSKAKKSLKPTYFESTPLDKKGEKFFTGWILPETKNGKFHGTIFTLIDDTERKKASDQVEKSLHEKEILIKEVHHRVKNNLQIISSLLNLQSMYVEDKKDSELFQKAQNRVKSMALIHTKLYQSENLSHIDFKEYIPTLTHELLISYEMSSKIQLEIDVDEEISLNLETAIPCGLIITELVSNSLKYAFPDDDKEGIKEGKITVSLKKDEKGNLILIESDNGAGIPEDIDLEKTETLGLELVNMLVKQLEGNIELDKTNGTKFIIKFPPLKYPERT